MGWVTPQFPNKIWDGLSDNPDRTSRSVNKWCNHQDWDRISTEVIAIQEFILSSSGGDDKFSLYSATATENIDGGKLVALDSSGDLVLADSDTGKVAGLSLTSGSAGNGIVYLRQGRIVSSDWTNTIGSMSLSPSETYYLRSNGTMSTSPPSTGYLIEIGQAQGFAEFDILIQRSIKL